MVVIEFEFTTVYGVFRDAIHLADNHDLTEQEILLLQQERLDNWVALVSAPETDPPPDIPEA